MECSLEELLVRLAHLDPVVEPGAGLDLTHHAPQLQAHHTGLFGVGKGLEPDGMKVGISLTEPFLSPRIFSVIPQILLHISETLLQTVYGEVDKTVLTFLEEISEVFP